MKLRNRKIKNITEYSSQNRRKSVLPGLEKAKAASTPGLSIMLDDDDILTVIDQQYYGRTFVVKDEGIYTVRLGAFHNMNKGALEEAAVFCTIPTRSDYEQQLAAAFDIPEASARFLDAIILKATRPFSVKLIPGSPVLERHSRQWGIPLKYDSVRADDVVIMVRTGLRKNVPSQYKIYFDVLNIQLEIIFEK